MTYKLKRAVVRTSLLALGAGFDLVSRHSRELQAEIATWEEGRVFSLGVLPNGPRVSFRKEGDRIRYLGTGDYRPSLEVLFKNLDCALLPLSGRISADTAFVQRRAILRGSISQGIQTGRALRIVQAYLLPGFMLRRMMKRAPALDPVQRFVKAGIMAALGVMMLLSLGK